jgi:hypothetical protein
VVLQAAASLGLKPEPEKVTVAPSEATLGVKVIEGEYGLTSKVADAESPVLPVTVTTYWPLVAVAATVKLLVVSLPPETVHVGAVTIFTGVLSTVQVVSPELKPLPVTVTPVLCGPEAGVREILGPVTTKLADAISPVSPLTETVYVPGFIGDATTKLLPVN